MPILFIFCKKQITTDYLSYDPFLKKDCLFFFTLADILYPIKNELQII